MRRIYRVGDQYCELDFEGARPLCKLAKGPDRLKARFGVAVVLVFLLGILNGCGKGADPAPVSPPAQPAPQQPQNPQPQILPSTPQPSPQNLPRDLYGIWESVRTAPMALPYSYYSGGFPGESGVNFSSSVTLIDRLYIQPLGQPLGILNPIGSGSVGGFEAVQVIAMQRCRIGGSQTVSFYDNEIVVQVSSSGSVSAQVLNVDSYQSQYESLGSIYCLAELSPGAWNYQIRGEELRLYEVGMSPDHPVLNLKRVSRSF